MTPWFTLKTSVAAGVVLLLHSHAAAAQEFPAGIVFGPKAAFEIAAPRGWVLSNVAGQTDGLPCVLYLQSSSWRESPVVMYAKIASVEFTEHEAFATWAVQQFKKKRTGFGFRRLETGRTEEGRPYLVNEYRGGNFDNVERVAYVQLPGAVAYIVLAARGEQNYTAHAAAVSEVVRSMRYRPEYINYQPVGASPR
jgi:hypothetical protein